MSELLVLIDGHPVGRASSDRHGNPCFVYDEAWRSHRDAVPLSLSLPLAESDHSSDTVSAVMWGFLPDNERVLQHWASRFHVSPRNPLSLLAHVGEDCAGAAQFVRPERLDEVLGDGEGKVAWLDEASVAERLRQVLLDAGQTRRPSDIGQFSLAGAQPKIALHRDAGRWGVPQGRMPTTHILKPPTGDFDGYVENEHFCLNLARRLGLSVCKSEVVHFGDEIAICVERYDRRKIEGRWWRVHQEDFCQALGVMPQRKYQNEGGPSPARMAYVLQQYSSQPQVDRENFFFALVFNWLIGGTDAHAKNYSVLMAPRADVILAPLYDISSALPYPELDRRRLTMAMKVGNHYRWHDINMADWIRLGEELGFREAEVRRVMALATRMIADEASAQARQMRAEKISHPVVDRLVNEIANSAGRSVLMLSGRGRDASQPR